ncbi:MAG: 3-keto-5-aminohexanoate cleavage protein [Bryobacteraceae bacterium]
MANKVIITCAITGSIHTPSMSPYLPLTPDQIATSAIEAAEAGAAILHVHAREPENGRPSGDPAIFMQFLPRIKAATDAVINITTGGAITMTVDERMRAALTLKPEMASLNMGSMNFAFYTASRKIKDWKYDWEQPYVEGTEANIFPNTFRDIKRILKTIGEGCGTRFEFECYDLGHLYNLAHILDEGLIKPPLFVQTIFGVLGGMGTDPENLMHIRATADRLLGRENYQWSILAAGRHQMPLTTVGAIMGSNVRVGLEDSLFLEKGKLAQSNADQVRKIKRILGELGMEFATPGEARAMLQLKGAANVGF